MNRQFGRDPEPGSGHNPGVVFVNDMTSEVEMRPWIQRIIIGLVVAVTAGGIAATSSIIVKNLETSSRIETKIEDISVDLDRFIDIRYQSDMERVHERLLAVETEQKQE